MRARLTTLLAARPAGTALGAFTCYESSTATGVLAAAETAGQPVALLVSPGSAAASYGPRLIAALRAMADAAAVPVCVQLDHARTEDSIRAAFDAGADSALADGSHLDRHANAAFVRAAVDIAAAYGGTIEAELGRLDGDEDRSGVRTGTGVLTDPADVAPFLADTGADLLAVSIGNRHGGPAARLDWPRLDRIRAASSVPLALHGASGLPAAQLRRAVAAGVGKVNVNTELRRAALAALRAELPGRSAGEDLHGLVAALVDATAVAAADVLDVLATDPVPA